MATPVECQANNRINLLQQDKESGVDFAPLAVATQGRRGLANNNLKDNKWKMLLAPLAVATQGRRSLSNNNKRNFHINNNKKPWTNQCQRLDLWAATQQSQESCSPTSRICKAQHWDSPAPLVVATQGRRSLARDNNQDQQWRLPLALLAVATQEGRTLANNIPQQKDLWKLLLALLAVATQGRRDLAKPRVQVVQRLLWSQLEQQQAS